MPFFVKKSRGRIGAKIIVLGLIFISLVMVEAKTESQEIFNEEILPLEQISTQRKAVALTVNVDWGEEQIPAMLDLFDRYGSKVTFFVTGKWAEKNPDLLREMAQRGHQIGNHGYAHSHPDRLPPEKTRAEILKTQQIIAGITGLITAYYAPPYGERESRGLQGARESGHITVLWTLDTVDWREDSTPEKIVRRILNPPRREGLEAEKKGAIILMHPRANTVQALPEILGWFQKNEFEMITLGALIKSAGVGNTTP